MKDTMGILKYSKDIAYINKPSKTIIEEIDLLKIMNAFLRFRQDGAFLKITPKNLIISSKENTETLVKLAATEKDIDLNILPEIKKELNPEDKYNHSQKLNDIYLLISKLMNGTSPNNSIVFQSDDTSTEIIYADRSLVYKKKCDLIFKDPEVAFHSFILGFIIATQDFLKASYYYDNSKNAIYLESDTVTAYILSEKPNINIPSEDDLKQIRVSKPFTHANMIKISLMELLEGLTFFEGFYEGDEWKPLTFNFSPQEKELRYKNATIDINKSLECVALLSEPKSVFTLMSSPLQIILNSLLNENQGNDIELTLIEKEDKPGVSLIADGFDFELVLAKLNY